MTIPPLSSSEDESALIRQSSGEASADAEVFAGLDAERAAALASDLRSPSIDRTRRWHTKDAVYATKPRALLDAAADALLAPSDPSTAWREIASAPRDGARVLLSWGTLWIGEGWFNTSDECWYEANTGPTSDTDGEVYPTHWMPLPGAPS